LKLNHQSVLRIDVESCSSQKWEKKWPLEGWKFRTGLAAGSAYSLPTGPDPGQGSSPQKNAFGWVNHSCQTFREIHPDIHFWVVFYHFGAHHCS